MYGKLLPKSVTRLNLIPNLLLCTPPPYHLNTTEPAVENTERNKDSECAKFPNSVPDTDKSNVTTSHAELEDPEYDGNLDKMLLHSMDKSQPTNRCPIHPGCEVNSTSG